MAEEVALLLDHAPVPHQVAGVVEGHRVRVLRGIEEQAASRQVLGHHLDEASHFERQGPAQPLGRLPAQASVAVSTLRDHELPDAELLGSSNQPLGDRPLRLGIPGEESVVGDVEVARGERPALAGGVKDHARSGDRQREELQLTRVERVQHAGAMLVHRHGGGGVADRLTKVLLEPGDRLAHVLWRDRHRVPGCLRSRDVGADAVRYEAGGNQHGAGKTHDRRGVEADAAVEGTTPAQGAAPEGRGRETLERLLGEGLGADESRRETPEQGVVAAKQPRHALHLGRRRRLALAVRQVHVAGVGAETAAHAGIQECGGALIDALSQHFQCLRERGRSHGCLSHGRSR